MVTPSCSICVNSYVILITEWSEERFTLIYRTALQEALFTISGKDFNSGKHFFRILSLELVNWSKSYECIFSSKLWKKQKKNKFNILNTKCLGRWGVELIS